MQTSDQAYNCEFSFSIPQEKIKGHNIKAVKGDMALETLMPSTLDMRRHSTFKQLLWEFSENNF